MAFPRFSLTPTITKPILTPKQIIMQGFIAKGGEPGKPPRPAPRYTASEIQAMKSKHVRPLPGETFYQAQVRAGIKPPPRYMVPRIRPPQPGAVQTFINKWTGATPEDPIKLPFEYGQVKVKAERQTRNLLLTVAGVGIAAIVLWPRK